MITTLDVYQPQLPFKELQTNKITLVLGGVKFIENPRELGSDLTDFSSFQVSESLV